MPRWKTPKPDGQQTQVQPVHSRRCRRPWWHYTGLKADLATAQADLANARAQMVAAVELAQGNAEQLRKAEAQHRAAIAALEEAWEEMTRIADAARAEDQEILSAPPEAGGPVPDVLADHLLRRYE